MKELIAKGSHSNAVKEYAKHIKTLAKKMGSEVAKEEKALKKLGFMGSRTECKAVAAAKASATSTEKGGGEGEGEPVD